MSQAARNIRSTDSDDGGAVPPPSAPVAETGARRLARLREELTPYRKPNLAVALALFAGDLLLLVAGQALVLLVEGPVGLILGALLTWVATVRLFLIGHDACHGSYTGQDWLNRLIGRVAFLPSLTPFSLWHMGHNVVHHGFNNLRGRDFVWAPLERAEYEALPAWRKRVERLYRSAWGPGVYYGWEIWWKRLYFPGLSRLGTRRPQFVRDCTLVTVAAAVWIGGLLYAAARLGLPAVPVLLAGFVVPFLLWNWTVGLVIYLHHTAPDVRWFDNKREWMQEAAQATGTAHLVMPWPLGPLLHHIMEHPAHHLDSGIPLYRLKAAQRRLGEILPEVRPVQLTFAHYMDCVRQCKLYDYEARSWIPFPDDRDRLPATA